MPFQMTKKFCVQIAIDSLFILYVRIATALFVLRVRIALGSIRTSRTNSHDDFSTGRISVGPLF